MDCHVQECPKYQPGSSHNRSHRHGFPGHFQDPQQAAQVSQGAGSGEGVPSPGEALDHKEIPLAYPHPFTAHRRHCGHHHLCCRHAAKAVRGGPYR